MVPPTRAVESDLRPSPAALPSFAVLKQVLRGERVPVDRAEAEAVLMELARRKSGRLPATWLVRQVLRVTEGTDWASQRAAMDAVLRRVGFAVRDGLRIAARPAQGVLLGRYALAGGDRSGGRQPPARTVRPYRTEVYALDPLHVSCDCADFLRSSLGLCKHLLVVLEDIAAATHRSEAAPPLRAAPLEAPAALSWDPVRDWTGAGDRLSGLRWNGPTREQREPATSARARDTLPTLGAGFEQGRPVAALLSDVSRRAAWLGALVAAHDAAELSVEPAAIAVLRAELAVALRRREARASALATFAHTKTLTRELYPYQREGILRFLEEQRLLLADDMGLGKTTQAIASCHALYEAGRVRRGLLIVPAALKDQWQREWLATTARVPLVAVEGRAEERAQLYRQTQQGYLVMNYEQLLRDLEGVRAFAPELVVLDEAQRIKNWATKSSAYVMSLQPEWRLVLTGTPMENRLEELATLLDWIDDAALAPKWRLQPWHTTWNSVGRGERTGARHLDTLRQRLSGCVVRRIRREVLSQLPPRTDVRVPVEMTSQQREEHDARIVPIAQLLQAGRRRPLRQPEFLKLMQLLTQQRIISNGMAQLQFDEVWPTYSQAKADDALLGAACSPKLVEFRRLIRDLVIDQERKVVVFSQWRRMLRLAEWAVRDVLEENGLRSAFFTGQESQRLRTQNVVDFHDDQSVRVLFLSDAGGVGLNLQRAANACINLELPWNPAVLEQRIGRIYRLGQESPIDVINLVTEYGIEARIAGLVGNKRAVFSGLFDGTTDAVCFDAPASFLTDIERLVEPVQIPLPAGDGEVNELLDDQDDAADDEQSLEPAPDNGAVPSQGSVEPGRSVSPEGTASIDDDTVASSVATAPVPTPMAAALASLRVAPLFERITVTRTEDGGLRLEAPPEAAEELSQLLQGLAQLLRSSPGQPGRPG